MDNKIENIKNELLTPIYYKLISLSEAKDLFMDSDGVEVLSDSVSYIKGFKACARIYDNIKFEYFLKGLARDKSKQEKLKELYEYIDNRHKAEFISDAFSKIVNSNSKLSCYIMGIYINDLIDKEEDITQIDLLLFTALLNLNDYDIKNFKIIYENCLSRKGNAIDDRDIRDCAKKFQLDVSNLNLTLEICEKNNLIRLNKQVDLDMDEDAIDRSYASYEEEYRITNITKLFYNMVKNINAIMAII